MQALEPKDPQDVVDYPIDWTDVLTLDADTISSVDWTFPAGISKHAESVDGMVAVVWISGGTDGERYAIGCKVTTAGGRIYDRTLELVVRQA